MLLSRAGAPQIVISLRANAWQFVLQAISQTMCYVLAISVILSVHLVIRHQFALHVIPPNTVYSLDNVSAIRGIWKQIYLSLTRRFAIARTATPSTMAITLILFANTVTPDAPYAQDL